MKRELACVVGVHSQPAGSLATTTTATVAAASPTVAAQPSSCAEVSEDVRSKRLKDAKVNGFIVYSRAKFRNDSGGVSEGVCNKRIKSFDERKVGGIKASIDEDRKGESGTEESQVIESVAEEGKGVKEVKKERSHVSSVENVVSEKSKCIVVVSEDEAMSEKPLAVEFGSKKLFKRKKLKGIKSMPPQITPSKLKVEVEPVPVEVKVSGLEAIDSEAIARVHVETIAEGSALTIAEGSSPVTPPKKNLELKMSKKIALDNVPMTVKELFETGLLEGVPVVYMGGKKFQAFGLRGVIKDVGILCSCCLCRGHRVIPPSQFEIHAIKQYRRASQYICFENGKSLLDVLNVCRTSPLDSLEATIRSAISGLPEEKTFTCRRCKGTFPTFCVGKVGPLCNLCVEPKESHGSPRSEEPFSMLESSKSVSLSTLSHYNTPSQYHTPTQWKKPKKSMKKDGRKSSKSAAVRISSRKKIPWKITTKSSKLDFESPPSKSSLHLSLQKKKQLKITPKDQRLHKLVFEEDGLPDGTEVAYYARGQKLLVGYKRGFGILCRCCNCEVSPSTFEAHAGWATRKKPYAYIYTSNGVSLHELAISLSKGRRYSAKDNDDLCIICGDGGNLILCDGCPRAFHQGCTTLSSVPSGKWYCNFCQNMLLREKFMEHDANAVAAGRIDGVDSIEQITQRCIRIVKNIEAELSGCVLCRGYDFSRSGFGPRTIILCDQCEKEFHVGCLRSHKMANLKELPKGKWFCCPDCSRIHSSLQKLLVRGAEKLPDPLLNVIKKKHEEKGLEITGDIDVRWRLLSGKYSSPETKLLLSQALAIFQECFDPIVDTTIGRDLIPLMVYGKNSKGQDYGGMYCAVLMVNSFVVSAGILRVFGEEVAELPLVGTSNGNHGKGYFQLLFSCIEKLLAYLNVQSLVLPAAEEAESIWTDRFGFQKIKPDQLSRYRKSCCQMVTFKGTSMLQKMVPACQIVNQSILPVEYSKGVE